MGAPKQSGQTRKKAKRSSQENLPEQTRSFLSSALTTILQKMKWDEEQDPGDMDDDDKDMKPDGIVWEENTHRMGSSTHQAVYR